MNKHTSTLIELKRRNKRNRVDVGYKIYLYGEVIEYVRGGMVHRFKLKPNTLTSQVRDALSNRPTNTRLPLRARIAHLLA